MKTVVAIVALTVLTACAEPAQRSVQPPLDDPNAEVRTVNAGGSVVLDEFGFWTGDCRTRAFNLDVTQNPTFGGISIEDDTMQVPKAADVGTVGSCAGQLIESREVIYTPNAGYQGYDIVRLIVGNQSGSREYAYKINVN